VQRELNYFGLHIIFGTPCHETKVNSVQLDCIIQVVNRNHNTLKPVGPQRVNPRRFAGPWVRPGENRKPRVEINWLGSGHKRRFPLSGLPADEFAIPHQPILAQTTSVPTIADNPIE